MPERKNKPEERVKDRVDLRRKTEMAKAEMEILAEAGWTAGDIAMYYKIPLSQVRRLVKSLGLQLSREYSHGALQLRKLLEEALPGYQIIEEYHIGKRLRLDFFLPELMIGFEFDGPQHQVFNGLFHRDHDAFLESKFRDRLKEELCMENHIKLFRIPAGQLPTPETLREMVLNYLETI